MRHATKCLTAAIALACANAAAVTVTPAPGGTTRQGTITRSNIFTPSAASAVQPTTITINQPANVTPRPVENTTKVDVRAQQTEAATAGTHSSGSTSSLGPLANAGATSGAGATGAGSSTGAGTGTTTTTVPFTTVVGSPFIVNPADATTGSIVSNAAALPMASNGTIGASDVYSAPLLASNGIIVTEDQLQSRANATNVDRAIAQVQRDRKRIGRNGQLLYSIAPRTNVDRSHEAPDDGPTPALSGYNSALAR
jgi:hypothetical protein